MTGVCVKANVLDALKYGYDIELFPDGIRGLSPEDHKSTLDYFASLDGTLNAQGRIQSVKIIA